MVFLQGWPYTDFCLNIRKNSTVLENVIISLINSAKGAVNEA